MNYPNAYSVNAAVCANESIVHYANHHVPEVSGIIEFMSAEFLHEFYPKWYKQFLAANMTWHDEKSWKFITPIQCKSLSSILEQAFVTHVDFFILDVEGAEFEVLQTVDWSKFSASVLCIETDPAFRPPNYADKIRNYLTPKGYAFAAEKGRNSWYVNKDFVPSARPGLPSDCYRGLAFLRGFERQPACEGRDR